MNRNDLLQRISTRTGRHGVLTADRYFSSVTQCFGTGPKPDSVLSLAGPEVWEQKLKEASQKFTYSAEDAVVDMKSISKGEDSVNNCVMRFEAVITTSLRDRDGDVLETAGAIVDPKMALLWQHIPVQPIGALVRITQHTDSVLKGLFTIADTDLGRDAAKLVEIGALRISHGFDPHEFEEMDDEKGWLFKKFEVYETSLVSTPSNVQAEVVGFDRLKFRSPLVKAWASHIVRSRPVIVPGHKCAETPPNGYASLDEFYTATEPLVFHAL